MTVHDGRTRGRANGERSEYITPHDVNGIWCSLQQFSAHFMFWSADVLTLDNTPLQCIAHACICVQNSVINICDHTVMVLPNPWTQFEHWNCSLIVDNAVVVTPISTVLRAVTGEQVSPVYGECRCGLLYFPIFYKNSHTLTVDFFPWSLGHRYFSSVVTWSLAV